MGFLLAIASQNAFVRDTHSQGRSWLEMEDPWMGTPWVLKRLGVPVVSIVFKATLLFSQTLCLNYFASFLVKISVILSNNQLILKKLFILLFLMMLLCSQSTVQVSLSDHGFHTVSLLLNIHVRLVLTHIAKCFFKWVGVYWDSRELSFLCLFILLSIHDLLYLNHSLLSPWRILDSWIS